MEVVGMLGCMKLYEPLNCLNGNWIYESMDAGRACGCCGT